jgi:adenine-specific DNA-methyltransferase
MNKLDLITKVKALDSITQDERAYLINLINTKKKYGLVWEDKPEDVEELLRYNLPVLKDIKEKAILNGEEHPNHILIEGDNLHALTALTFTHEGKIDVMYFDPPYNTGNKDFKYNDSFVDKEDSYRHSKWISFMNKRLLIAKRLLSENGIVFISIDDNEVCQLKILCDEIFGQNNCENIFTIKVRHENRVLRQDIRYHQSTEYLLAYRKTDSFIPPRRENEREIDNDYKYNIEIIGEPVKVEKIAGYNVEIYNPDSFELKEVEPSKGDLKSYSIRGSLITQSGSASEYYEKYLRERKELDGYSTLYKVVNMGTRGDGLGYRYIMQPQNSRVKNGTYFQGKPIKSKSDQGLPYPNYFDFVNEFNNVGYEGGIEFKNGKKPLNFLKKVFELSNLKNNSIILDFFGGSGSTMHCIIELNKEKNYNNTCILVTNNENQIAEKICYERNKKVIEGYTDEVGNVVEGRKHNNLRYFKADFVLREQTIKNKKELTKLSTDLLCIKEDIYKEVKQIGEYILNPTYVKCFTSANKILITIYDEEIIDQIVEVIKNTVKNSKEKLLFKVYVFSNGQYPYTEEFEDVLEHITLCALPDAIYKAYQNVLPKKQRQNIPQLDEEIIDTNNPLDN